MPYVRPQIIESPNYKKQKRITDNLNRRAVREEKRDEKSRDKWSADLKPVAIKHPASYTRYWYANGRAA